MRIVLVLLCVLMIGQTNESQALAAEPSPATANQPDASRQLNGLPPALAQALRAAHNEAQRQVAALADASSRADVWGNLGMLYHAQRLRYLAEKSYDKALIEADKARWRYLRAIVLSERGEIERSIIDFQHTVEAQPANMAAWYRLGVALFLTGELALAETALREAQQQTPDSALVLATLADVAVAGDNPREALDLLKRAWALEPEAGQTAYKLARVYRSLGNAEAARIWLGKRPGNRLAPKIDDPLLLEVAQMSRTARFYEIAADWAMARGDQQQALEALRNAVEFAPEDVNVGLRFASALDAGGNATEAVTEARRILTIDAKSAPSWYLLGWLLRKSKQQGDLAEAMSAMERSLAIVDSTRARELAAALSMRSRQFAKAKAHYKLLISQQPTKAFYHYWLAMARLGRGDCRGRTSLGRALQLRQDWGEVHIVLARAEAMCGAVETARQRAEALLKVKNNVDTRLTLALVELAAGRANEAERLATAELPHPDATMVLDALKPQPVAQSQSSLLFSLDSAWWLPPEVQ